MKKTIIPIIFLSLSAVFVSCKKSLDNIIPTALLEETRAFTNVTDLEQGLLAVYSAWPGENTMYINALLSDEVRLSEENRGQGQFEFKYQFNSSNNSFGFNAFYVMINRANRVLEAMSRVTTTTAADETKKLSIKAEAQALRAYAHFELLQRYAPPYDPNALGITYINYVFVNDKLAREKVSDNIAKIEADLVEAKAGPLSVTPAITAGYGTIRLSKAAIAGFQARVALYKKDWANAATFATEAITTSAKPLATRTEFPLIWTDDSEVEVFLKLRRTGTGVGTLWQDTNGDVFFEPSDKLKQQYSRTTDIRFPTYFLIGNTAGDTALIRKFYSSSRGPKIVDVKLMRTAEMYLIRAEARAESNDLIGAASDINTLRTARISNYTNVTYSTKDAAIADILSERYRELAFEGFRYFDLKRRGLPVARLLSDVQSTQWQNVAATDYRILTLPIPQTELLANPNSTQNTGY